MPCLAPSHGTPTAIPVEEVDPDLTPWNATVCRVCGSPNTYNETDANGQTWVICINCGARVL
jgi:ribosomal protein L40E